MTPTQRIMLRRDAATYLHELDAFRRQLEALSDTLNAIQNGVYDLVHDLAHTGGGADATALQHHARLFHLAHALAPRAEVLAKTEAPLRLAAFFGRVGAPSEDALVEAGRLVAEFTGAAWPEGTVPSTQALHESLTQLVATSGQVAALELLPELAEIFLPYTPGALVFVDEEKP